MVQDISSDVAYLKFEVRKILGILARIAVGGQVNVTNLSGPLPPSGGGSGVSGSPLGVTIWQNQSGATRARGTVVVENGDRTYGVTTSVGNEAVIGVQDDDTLIVGAEARIRHIGYQPLILVQGVVTAGHYLRTSTTAARAEDAGVAVGGVPPVGSFGIALTASGGGAGQVAAVLFPPRRSLPSPASSYTTIEDEGTPLTQRSTMDFVGAGVSAADAGGKTVVTISGAAASGAVTKVRTYISFGTVMAGEAVTP
jgi:hypothetical protein